MPCGSSLEAEINKHMHTHCFELQWQTLIPVLAYERRQLEGFAFASAIANACCSFIQMTLLFSVTFASTFTATLLWYASLVLSLFFFF